MVTSQWSAWWIFSVCKGLAPTLQMNFNEMIICQWALCNVEPNHRPSFECGVSVWMRRVLFYSQKHCVTDRLIDVLQMSCNQIIVVFFEAVFYLSHTKSMQRYKWALARKCEYRCIQVSWKCFDLSERIQFINAEILQMSKRIRNGGET